MGFDIGRRTSAGSLSFDVMFVKRRGPTASSCDTLIGQVSEAQRQEWSSGTPADWAMEAVILNQALAASP